MALTERESADKHTTTSRRTRREADIQPPSGGRRTQPIMSELVGKASLALRIKARLPSCLTMRPCDSQLISRSFPSAFMEMQKSNRPTLNNPSPRGIINHKQIAIKRLKIQSLTQKA